MQRSKKILSVLLVLALAVSLLSTFALAVPPVVTGKVVVGGDDYRVAAGATSLQVTLNTSIDTAKWKSFVSGKMYMTGTNGVAIDSVLYSRLATGSAIYTADRDIFTIDDEQAMQPTYINLDISTITDSTKVSTVHFERAATHIFSVLPIGATNIAQNVEIEQSESELRDIRIIVQQPVTVKVTGAGNGNAVSVPTTSYTYDSIAHPTYDSAGTATSMTSSTGTAIYVDTGAGMQNTPAFNYTVADGYKLVITDGGTTLADIETSGTYTMSAAVVAAKNIEFKFVKVATNVTVTVNPTAGGSVKVGATEAGATLVPSGESVTYKANTPQTLWIIPATGYEIDTVKLDDVDKNVAPNGSLTLSFTEAEAAAAENYNLVVTFKLKKYSVAAVVDGTGGSIKVGDTNVMPAITGVDYGTNNLSVNIVPDTGYELVKLEIKNNSTNWADTALASTYNFPAITSENFGIRATFALKTYDVAVTWTGNGKVQYNAADISSNKISGVTHGTSAKFTFVPTSDSYQVDKIETTTNGGGTWQEVSNSRGLTEYTIASVEGAEYGIKVTFGPKVNSIAINSRTKADNYDTNSDGMVIMRGDWASESHYDLTALINDSAAAVGAVTWSIEGASEYGFNSNCVSVNAATGELTVLKSGIARARATSSLDPSKSCYVVVIVPGDYNRSNAISGTDATTVLQVNAEAIDLDPRPYSLELGDMNRNNVINGTDGTTIRSINAEQLFIVRF